MAISTVKFALGYGKVKADCAALVGLESATFRNVNYRHKPADQPRSIEVVRELTIVYAAPVAVPPAAPVSVYNFYGLPQSEWTIYFERNYTGLPANLETLYEMVLLECKLVVTDTDVHKYIVIFGMTTEKLMEKVNAKM